MNKVEIPLNYKHWMKKEKCVICQNAFLVRKKPLRNGRKNSQMNVRKYGSKTCSPKCSKIKIRKRIK